MYNSAVTRRQFMKNASCALAVPLIFGCRGSMTAQHSDDDILTAIKKNARTSGDDLSWSGAKDTPSDVIWRTILSDETAGVIPMLVSGTVFQNDQKTPAPNVLIYLYHTDVYGYYGRGGEHRHGRYRGWMLTDAQGRFEFRSIKPASYPNSTVASHIHMTLTGTDFQEDWVDSILFDGDRFLTERERVPQRGSFNHVLKLVKGTDGIHRATRNITIPA